MQKGKVILCLRTSQKHQKGIALEKYKLIVATFFYFYYYIKATAVADLAQLVEQLNRNQ